MYACRKIYLDQQCINDVRSHCKGVPFDNKTLIHCTLSKLYSFKGTIAVRGERDLYGLHWIWQWSLSLMTLTAAFLQQMLRNVTIIPWIFNTTMISLKITCLVPACSFSSGNYWSPHYHTRSLLPLAAIYQVKSAISSETHQHCIIFVGLSDFGGFHTRSEWLLWQLC